METIELGKRREMFWDDYLIDTERTTAFHRSLPALKKESCFLFDRGRELDNVAWTCLAAGERGYRMYYVVWNETYDGTNAFVIESEDGLTWKRAHVNEPDSGLEENRIVLPGLEDALFVFRDPNPACPPEEKYKAAARATCVCEDGEKRRGLWSWTSPDGCRFGPPRLISMHGTFDSMSTVHWANGRYVCYHRNQHGLGRDGSVVECTDANRIGDYVKQLAGKGKRDIRRITSEDFIHWSEPEMIGFDDGAEIDLYDNQIIPYPTAPHILVGFPTRYASRDNWTPNEEQFASSWTKKQAKKNYGEWRCGLATTDCVAMHSRDGIVWHRGSEPFITPGYEEEHNWVYGDCYPAYGMIDSGRETYWMYCAERYRSPGYPKPLYRYEIRRDGLGCIMADGEERVVVTKPLLFEGTVLHLNFESSACGYIRTEVLDADGSALPETYPTKCFEVYGNSVDRSVYFENGTYFLGYMGRPVRLRFTLCEAKLYSMRFE